MTTAVLVHGGWHSASCWDLVRAELTADGIRSVAPQLPMTSTLDVDAAMVRETLDSLDDDAVVVAHSWGGSPVTLGASGCTPPSGPLGRSARAATGRAWTIPLISRQHWIRPGHPGCQR